MKQNLPYSIGLLGATWFGNRVVIFFSGLFSTFGGVHKIMVEVRTTDEFTLAPFKLYFKV